MSERLCVYDNIYMVWSAHHTHSHSLINGCAMSCVCICVCRCVFCKFTKALNSRLHNHFVKDSKKIKKKVVNMCVCLDKNSHPCETNDEGSKKKEKKSIELTERQHMQTHSPNVQ